MNARFSFTTTAKTFRISFFVIFPVCHTILFGVFCALRGGTL